jgi:hypothetical protein
MLLIQEKLDEEAFFMHTGRLVFSQVMDYLPMHTFRQCVNRYQGNRKIKNFSCLDQFLCMAFAQLTYRESLRDIEVCLRAQHKKLYHMGIRGGIARNTLANANKIRDWRIYADLAQSLITTARDLYINEDLGLDLDNTVYALDASTIDLCLSVFPWATFRQTKAAIKLHTLLDLRGNIPTFIHISDGKLHDVNVLDILIPEPGAFYIMDRGYVDFKRLYAMNNTGAFFLIRAKSNTLYKRRYSHKADTSGGVICDQTNSADGDKDLCSLPTSVTSRKIPRYSYWKNIQLFNQQFYNSSSNSSRPVPETLAGGIVFQMDKTTSPDKIFLRYLGECGESTNLDRCISLRAHRNHKKTTWN